MSLAVTRRSCSPGRPQKSCACCAVSPARCLAGFVRVLLHAGLCNRALERMGDCVAQPYVTVNRN